ncbi:hypothetical protein BDW62DRAFT_139770 [Aspergillus aurantiobrunneus]
MGMRWKGGRVGYIKQAPRQFDPRAETQTGCIQYLTPWVKTRRRTSQPGRRSGAAKPRTPSPRRQRD